MYFSHTVKMFFWQYPPECATQIRQNKKEKELDAYTYV